MTAETDDYGKMCDLVATSEVTAFLSELDSRWTHSKKHFNDVQAKLVSSLEVKKAGFIAPSMTAKMAAALDFRSLPHLVRSLKQ